MGCNDAWAREIDDKIKKKKKIETILPRGKDVFLRFYKNSDRLNFLIKKNKSSEKKRKELSGCMKKLGKDVMLLRKELEKKKKKNTETKQGQENSEKSMCEGMKPTKKKSSNFTKLKAGFKDRLTNMLGYISEKVMVEKPMNIENFLANILEKKVEVRECLETVFEREISEDSFQIELREREEEEDEEKKKNKEVEEDEKKENEEEEDEKKEDEKKEDEEEEDEEEENEEKEDEEEENDENYEIESQIKIERTEDISFADCNEKNFKDILKPFQQSIERLNEEDGVDTDAMNNDAELKIIDTNRTEDRPLANIHQDNGTSDAASQKT